MIKRIELKNFKCIEHFEAEFSGGVYLITGENETGKSTILEAILLMLTGKRGETLLQAGKEKGVARMKYEYLDGNVYDIEVKFSAANPRGTFSITSPGSPFSSDKITALQTLFSYTDFDVVEFINWSATAEGRRKQLAMARKLLPTTMLNDINALEEKIAILTKDKTDANIRRTYANTVLKGLPQYTHDEIESHKTPIKVEELVDEINKKREYNLKYKNALDTVAQYDRELAAHKKEMDLILTNKTELERKLNEKPKPYELLPLETKLKTVGEFNHTCSDVAAFVKTTNEVMATETEYASHEQELLQTNYERTELIKANPFPIPNLEFDADGLVYKGMQVQPGVLSTSEEMELAARLVMALNPNTKVFRIAQGESMGAKRLESIANFAKANGYQGFIEQVVRNQDNLMIEEYFEADTASKPETGGVMPPTTKTSTKAKKTDNTTF